MLSNDQEANDPGVEVNIDMGLPDDAGGPSVPDSLPTIHFGCTDPSAENWDPLATVDDGSCTYPVEETEDGEPDDPDSDTTPNSFLNTGAEELAEVTTLKNHQALLPLLFRLELDLSRNSNKPIR